MATTLFTNNVTLSDAAWFNDVDSVVYPCTSVAGTNTITATGPNSLTALSVNTLLRFIPANTNTGATTFNVSSLGAKNVFSGGAACTGGEITANVPVFLYYDGTQFNIIGPRTASGTFTVTLTGVTATVTGTASYSVTNGVATVYYPPLSGTSNTTACTLTGQPAAIKPTTAHSGFVNISEDNSSSQFARADIGTDGVVTLYVSATSSTFTSSGTKGLGAGWTVTYDLN